MIISAIRQTAPDRVTVTFDDGTEVKSTPAVVTELKLFRSRMLDEKAVEQLKSKSRLSIARDRAIQIISRRQMSEKELCRKLMEKGEDRETAEFCAAWLRENGFIDDARYAGAVVRHYAAKGYGAGRAKVELSRRGIARELWAEALDELPETNPKIDRFISSRLTDPGDRDQIRKVTAALYRRGFSREEINAAMERYTDDYYEEFSGDDC